MTKTVVLTTTGRPGDWSWWCTNGGG